MRELSKFEAVALALSMNKPPELAAYAEAELQRLFGPEEVDHVEPDFGCPSCGETRMDRLIWLDDDLAEYVRCETCGEEYTLDD